MKLVSDLLIWDGAPAPWLDVPDIEGFTPLMEAVREQNCAIIEILLKAGVDANKFIPLFNTHGRSREMAGATPLILASQRTECDLEIVKALLAKGANVNAQDNKGRSPLMYACHWRTRNIPLAECLLDHPDCPADADAVTKLGRSALWIIAADAGASIPLPLVRGLLTRMQDPHRADFQGRTPLHVACSGGKIDLALIEMLATHVSNGASPLNATDKYKRTPLWLAARCGRADATGEKALVELLLNMGADVDAADINGLTPLASALVGQPDHRYENALEATVNTLLDRGQMP